MENRKWKKRPAIAGRFALFAMVFGDHLKVSDDVFIESSTGPTGL
jgi:hypothetical protein